MSEVQQYTDEEAQAALVWLTATAPGQLVDYVGGAVTAPAFDERTIEYLDGIEDTVKKLKRYAKKNESEEPVLPDADLAQPEELRQHRKTDKEIAKEEEEAAKAAERQAAEAEKAAAKANK